MQFRQIGPYVAIAIAAVAAGQAILILTDHHSFAMLIGSAFSDPNKVNTKAPEIVDMTTKIQNIQGKLQGFEIGATPLALAAGGVAWSAGHRRGVGISLAAVGGLALSLLSGPIAG